MLRTQAITASLLTLLGLTVLSNTAQAQAIVTAADLKRWNTETNVQNLAKVIMSEASVGNSYERVAVAFTVLNRMKRNGVNSVSSVWGAYAHGQAPTATIISLARNILANKVTDTSAGATHFYSPRSMPMEGDRRVGDTGGGLERVLPLPRRNYRPSWAVSKEFVFVEIAGARSHYYKFYRRTGNGRVY